MTVVLIPFKGHGETKSRLSGVLTPDQRQLLSLNMLQDVFITLSAVDSIDKTILVSSDPRAADLAKKYGIDLCRQFEGLSSDVNLALEMACDHLSKTYSGDVIILPADLPQIQAQDIQGLISLREQAGSTIIIGPDEKHEGTNALLFQLPRSFPLQFGTNSFSKHKAQTRRAGLNIAIYETPSLAQDLDTPADFENLINLPEPHTIGEQTRSFITAHKGLYAPSKHVKEIIETCKSGILPSDSEALSLATYENIEEIKHAARGIRDHGFANVITYSRKVFIPLTKLCRDVCHYCTFATTPSKIKQPFMSVDEVITICKDAEAKGCKEALFTLGEKPELRYAAARQALKEMGFESTVDYLTHVAERVAEETRLLPHINAGNLTAEEFKKLKPVSASMGIMLESSSQRLCKEGMPHFGSPDKDPLTRLKTIETAGEHKVPLTSGILIGIGETRQERIESLLALREAHKAHGHIQEIIIQNFRAKPGTKMAQAEEPDIEELTWTIAIARLIFGSEMSLQVPPNLNAGQLEMLIAAGINDWGGVSPVTQDFVNPEAPWPEIEDLSLKTKAAGKILHERLTIYPAFIQASDIWLDPKMKTSVLHAVDASGLVRTDSWLPGEKSPPPQHVLLSIHKIPPPESISPDVSDIIAKCMNKEAIDEAEITRLFNAHGEDFSYICQKADQLRQKTCGNVVTYVVNRNINYTNICTYRCQFCAFSKGKRSENLGGKPYNLDNTEIIRRTKEAWSRGASEVCMQGGIHPSYTGQTYLDILKAVKSAVPEMHVHAFSPLEIWQGAQSHGVSVKDFLMELRQAGLGSLPGTAAEILDDDIRALICPDKIGASDWLNIMETAHKLGIKTTATMMFGHVDSPKHWARHLIKIRNLQKRTGGFTEFVPLPFVSREAPIFLKGQSRLGPTFRETVLVHAVARLVFHGLIDNIQGSWVKLGFEGMEACLRAGVNDAGGTLMNESITRAAGAKHGEEWAVEDIEETVSAIGRTPKQRTTIYKDALAR